MRNINGYLKNIIGAEFSKIFNVSNETVERSSFVVEYPKNKSDGELSTNICMVLAKEISANPVEAAKTLIKSLEKIEDFEMLEVAGPGFLNFNISKDTWFKFLSQLLETNLLFNEEIGLNKNINVGLEKNLSLKNILLQKSIKNSQAKSFLSQNKPNIYISNTFTSTFSKGTIFLPILTLKNLDLTIQIQ